MTAERHVLIVEDELVIALGLQAMLADLGFSSFAFASTDGQAIEQAGLRRPDLLTVDVGLLAGSGVEAVQAIEALCGPVPLIYVTGNGLLRHDWPDAVVVEKPFSQAQLAEAVQVATGRPPSVSRSPASLPASL